MPDVTAIGELLVDFACKSTNDAGYPVMDGHPGGAPANFLAALTKFGAKTALLGKVGNDSLGQLLIGTLNDAGIDTSGIISDDDVFTTLSFVTFDEHGDREFSFARKPGADTQISFEELKLSLIDESKIFHFGTLSLTDDPAKTATQKAIAYAKHLGKTITFDPNLRKPLWKNLEDAKTQMLWGLHQADIVKISDEEIEFLFGNRDTEKASEYIINECGVKLLFITLGKQGAYYTNGKFSGTVPNYNGVKTIDTTGAGDIFGGSAVWKFLCTGKTPEELSADELKDIATFACTSASLSTGRSGGISSVPEIEEVLKAMSE
jgi:sugar/nucleoside kinase (ribokinase family)